MPFLYDSPLPGPSRNTPAHIRGVAVWCWCLAEQAG